MNLNEQYAELCKQLGHLVANREAIEARIQLLLKAIRVLDSKAAELKGGPKSEESK